MKLKYRLLLSSIVGIGSFFNYLTMESAEFTEIQTGNSIVLEDQDMVKVNGPTAILVDTAGPGLQINGAAVIEVTNDGSGSRAVSFANKNTNHLGTGTEITLTSTNLPDSTVALGLYANSEGTLVTAEQLRLTATDDRYAVGISVNNGAAVDLGTGSTIKVTTESGHATGVQQNRSTFSMNEGKIEVSGNTATGISAHNFGGIYNLGNNTTLTATADSNIGYARGIEISSGGTVITANGLTIDAVGMGGSGIYTSASNISVDIDLGSNSKVTATSYGNSRTSGILLKGGGSLKADHLEVVVNKADGSSNYGILMDRGGTVDLGTGSSVLIQGGEGKGTNGWGAVGYGIDLDNGSTLTANQLTVEAKVRGYGMRIVGGSFADVGSGSYISSEDNHSAVELRNSRFVGNEVTIVNSGINPLANGGTALDVTNNGTAEVGAGSKVISNKGIGIYSLDSTVSYLGTEEQRNYIYGGRIGAYSQNAGAIDLAYTDIEIERDSIYSGGGIYVAGNQAVVNGRYITIQTDENSYGVRAIDRGHVNFTDDLVILAKSDQAMIAEDDGSWIKSTGKMDITGSLLAQDSGLIDLVMEEGSVLTGGSTALTGTVNLDMTQSAWNLTKDSTVTSLNGKDSIINFVGANGFNTLTAGSLEGNSHFFMRTDIEALQGDLLVVDNAQGSHKITVANDGSADVDGTERLVIVDTTIGDAQFTLTNQVELGGYVYDLRQVPEDEKDWELFGAKDITTPGKNPSTGAKSAQIFSGAYLLNYAENQTLLKRMGDLRSGKEDQAVWARVFGGKFTSSSDGFLHGFDMNYWGIQAGMDKKIEREDKRGTVYVGGFLGYSKGSIDYLKEGSSSIDSKSVGAYWTHIHRNGFYADAVFKYNWMNSDFKAIDSAGARVDGDDIDTRGFSASFELGRRYFFDKKDDNGEKIKEADRQGWYVEPQVQLTVGHQSGGSFTTSNGLRIKADSFRSVLGRAEMHVGYEVKEGKNPINIYGKLGVVKEFDGDMDYYLNSSKEHTSYGDTWKLWGVGITAQFKDKHNLYFELERASGGRFNQEWGINGGYRFSW